MCAEAPEVEYELGSQISGKGNAVGEFLSRRLVKLESLAHDDLEPTALIVHLIDGLDRGTCGPVSRAAAEQAAAWWTYLEAHASRAVNGLAAATRAASGSTLLGVGATLRAATERHRGRTATLVQPFPVSGIPSRTAAPQPARRRELERRLRDELLRLHPDRETRLRAARTDAGHVARDIIAAIL